MPKPKLMTVSYLDTKNSICLTCYADMLVFNEDGNGRSGELVGIRFGGYPEQVRAMSDTIYGGGTIRAEMENKIPLMLDSKPKQYSRQLSRDGVYSEAFLMAKDDDSNTQSSEMESTEQKTSARKVYMFTPTGDEQRLYEEIDKRVAVPLIPEFKDYLLAELRAKNILKKLCVVSFNEKFEAWELALSPDERNVIDVVENGLKSGAISIPNADNNDIFDNINTVSEYLREFGLTIAERIKKTFTPLFDPTKEPLSDEIRLVDNNIAENVGYHLYDAQLAAAEALKRRLDKHDPAIIVAECGSGKSKIGATALYASHLSAGKPKTFNIVMSPSHVTKKWVRELEETIPNCMAVRVKSITELDDFYKYYLEHDKTAFVVISKEKARDGYMHQPSVVYKKIKRGFYCPNCNTRVMMTISEDGDKYTVPVDAFYFRKQNDKNHRCEECGEVLWTALNPSVQSEWIKLGAFGFVHRRFAEAYTNLKAVQPYLDRLCGIISNPLGYFTATGAVRRFALSKYIKHKMRGKIDGLIVDELHEFAQNSGQGDAMADIAQTADKVVGMTATLINGYASGIFFLLYRLFPRTMKLDGKEYNSPEIFNHEYGVTESVFESSSGDYNANRRTTKRKIRERLLPGVSPLVFSRFLLENAVFLSLQDMGKELPEYEEIPIALEPSNEVKEGYRHIMNSFTQIMRSDKKAATKLLSAFMGLFTVYPDQPYAHDPIIHPFDDDVVIAPEDNGDIDTLQPKDIETLRIVKDKIAKREKVLLYASWTRIDTAQKLLKLLTDEGIKAKILTSTVAPDKREDWVNKELCSGLQVLICNPSIVETGLDLNAFTTLIYYNIAYNLFTLRQSSRRSWRINQTAPRIEVYFLYYRGVMQERAMQLMASKLEVAGLVEGNLSDEGLAAMSDCKDLTSQLAKELTTGIRANTSDVAEVFKRMAILKPESDKKPVTSQSVIAQTELSEVTPKQTTDDVFVFSTTTKTKAKKPKPTQESEYQLSLFDLISA